MEGRPVGTARFPNVRVSTWAAPARVSATPEALGRRHGSLTVRFEYKLRVDESPCAVGL